ncbi:MAG: malto-oligosyltrehalose synthase [Candidatus Omnitrophica bacterium]|nr:malto-oligosyltrehalose synthase [Candidatus Omnitrophota bacterium]MDD5553230.1 malto-oligosyltrehalose synthase [Candidatus Omnitrophota bacterium]
MNIPSATFRIQFNAGFGFQKAIETLRYLSLLGVSHIYASPIFKAKKGSDHGYDIVDPRALNPELGQESDFRRLIEEAHKNQLFWLQDIVPNHMSFDSANTFLMDVFEKGRLSRYYSYFDIDWDSPDESLKGKILAPFLDKPYAQCLLGHEINLVFRPEGMGIKYMSFIFPLNVKSYSRVFGLDRQDDLRRAFGENTSDLERYTQALSFLRDAEAGKGLEAEYENISQSKKTLWDIYNSNESARRFIDEKIDFYNGKQNITENFDALDELLTEQFFRLSYWKIAGETINYRRFFTIDGLVSVRVEDELVFDSTHEFIFRLINEGAFDALRVDHVDGIYSPRTYLERLRKKTPDAYIVVEKILGSGEKIPGDWPVQGTTGYDYLNCANSVFCDTKNAEKFTRTYHRFTGTSYDYGTLVRERKKMILEKDMGSSVEMLVALLRQIAAKDKYGRDFTLFRLRNAFIELLTNFPVYRTYICGETVAESDKNYLKYALDRAKENAYSFFYELNYIERVLLEYNSPQTPPAIKEIRMRLLMGIQQYTATLMAKGFEDTILYIHNNLISLNEVGGRPDIFGISKEEFHEFNQKRFKEAPYSMNAGSTQDTKRGEDARGRINALSEFPGEWGAAVKRWSAKNKKFKKKYGEFKAPDENDEYFIYQTLVGAFPFEEAELPSFRERVREYIIKAAREAKRHTFWTKPDEDYENACIGFVEGLLRENSAFLKEFLPFHKKIAFYGIFNSLSQVVMRITSPGIPDFYQGSELWDFDFVDPDNRRPVDFKKRMSILDELAGRQGDIPSLIEDLFAAKEDARIKLFLIYRLLNARRKRADIFLNGAYTPLNTKGKFAENIIAYMRSSGSGRVLVAVPRFLSAVVKEDKLPLGEPAWQETSIILPKDAAGRYEDAISENSIICSGELKAGDAFRYFPACVLAALPE